MKSVRIRIAYADNLGSTTIVHEVLRYAGYITDEYVPCGLHTSDMRWMKAEEFARILSGRAGKARLCKRCWRGK